MKVILYTTNCPKCLILEKKLESKGIIYERVIDLDLMLQKGFMSAPILEVDGKIMNYKESFNFIENLNK